MGHLKLLIAVSCFCYVQTTMVNPEEVDRFTAADSKSGRLSTVYKNPRDNIAAPSNRQASNIVYGKSKPLRPAYVAPTLKGKPVVNKFKPSQEDSGYDTEAVNTYAHGYKPTPQETAALQKYMQRYASQVLQAQKHSTQLSEAQKQVVSNDPYKKFTPSKYKFIPIESKPSGEKLKDHDTVEIGTEKYQSFQVHQHVVVQPAKSPKFVPKKAYSYDSAHQPSDYQYSSQDSKLATSLFNEPEKDSWADYEPYQYGIMSQEKKSELSKITGYKIPVATSISSGHSVESKDHHHEEKEHEEEEHHYPHHEPKYEYMYQVHDPKEHNNFGHSEARKGKTTVGRYYVQLPDGRLETVKYWSDKSGYHAEVEFKGEAKHPHVVPHKEHKEYKEYHHEEPAKVYKPEGLGLGGHSESSYSLSEDTEEY